MRNMAFDLHGGNIYKAARKYGINQYEILDFSANINPFGVPESVKSSIISNLDNLINYPDPECTGLRMGISEYLGVGEDNIIVGNGASEVISLVFRVYGIKKLLMPAPTFSEYSKAAEGMKVEIDCFELKEAEGFKLNVENLKGNIAPDTDAILLCNPNNPTSTMVSKADLISLIEYAKGRGISVILDEAFIELTDKGNLNSMADKISDYDNMFIIRAFTKLFAIPGLRLGYGIGSREVISRMWSDKMPWSVNSLACCLGSIFRDEEAYLEKTSMWLKEEKKWLYNQLNSFDELKVFEPQTNFILARIRPESLTSAGLREKMAIKGILIRDASNFKFLNEKFVRFAVRDRKSNEKLVSAISEVLRETCSLKTR